jgi:hypothetical protein
LAAGWFEAPEAPEALFAESLDLARRMGMRANAAYALIGLALAARGGADPGWSARLHGAADQALAELGHALQPLEARLADLDRQRLRAAMGTEAFEAAYAAGRAPPRARARRLSSPPADLRRAGGAIGQSADAIPRPLAAQREQFRCDTEALSEHSGRGGAACP